MRGTTKFENIPCELKLIPQWVCSTSDSKVPYKAFIDKNPYASSINPLTWSTYECAEAAVSNGCFDWCGFVFANNGYVAIDIDQGYDQEGFISPLAAHIIHICKSYTEKSKSGRGFHIIVKGDLPFTGKNNLQGIEIYKESRYFILTGDTLLFQEIIENQGAIDSIVSEHFSDKERVNHSTEWKNRIYTPIWDTPVVKNRIKVRPTYPKIPNGSRNISLTSLAGHMHSQGYTKSQIYNELQYVNNIACQPPLNLSELRTICNSVTKYRR